MSFALFQTWRVEVEAMERLDRLEGNLLKMNGELKEGVIDIGGLDGKEGKVRGTLFRHVEPWRAVGAGAFALGVIMEEVWLEKKEEGDMQDDSNKAGSNKKGTQHKTSRSGSGQSVVNRHIRSKFENRSGTGQTIVNSDGRMRAIFEEEQKEMTNNLNTAFDDSEDEEAAGGGT